MKGDILYTKGHTFEEDNKNVKIKMTGANKLCEDFKLSCSDHEGVYAIWFQLEDKKFTVNPLDLFNSLFNDETYYMLEDTDKTDQKIWHVNIRLVGYTFEWIIYNPIDDIYTCKMFTTSDYITKIKIAFRDLCREWSNGKNIAYKSQNDIELECVKMCCKQLEVKAVMPYNYEVMTKDVILEKFTFNPASDVSSEKYIIGIGDRIHESFFTQWDNDLESIRHQFESLAYTSEATIGLSFDSSETILNIKKVKILDKINQTGYGRSFKYKDLALVTIIPNEHVRMPIILGYCDLKQTVKTLYEGLLRLSLMYPDDLDTSSDVPTFIEAYNMIKSPIIERIVTGEKRNPKSAETRQTSIKLVLRILPDCCEILLDWKGRSYDVDWNGLIIPESYDSEFKLLDKNGKHIVMKELVDWQQDMASIDLDAEFGIRRAFDWKDFHERGLRIAQELRSKLSSDIDLWYSAPSWIDNSGIVEQSILILK